MLRIRRNLRPRIPNLLAAPCALLLIVSAFVGTDDSMSAAESALNRYTTIYQETMEEPQSTLSDAPADTRRGLKISLMLFH
jgi:hypothetical protein